MVNSERVSLFRVPTTSVNKGRVWKHVSISSPTQESHSFVERSTSNRSVSTFRKWHVKKKGRLIRGGVD